jgi:hypothetical protein
MVYSRIGRDTRVVLLLSRAPACFRLRDEHFENHVYDDMSGQSDTRTIFVLNLELAQSILESLTQ